MHRSNWTGWRRLIVVLPTLFLTGILLIGCQSTRTLPDWQGEKLEQTTTDPLPACTWPDFVEIEVNDKVLDGGFLNKAGLSSLAMCRKAAEKNHDIAAANSELVRKLIALHNKTQEQGQRYIDLAEFQLNELERDRREANLEAWTYKGLLALVLIGIAL